MKILVTGGAGFIGSWLCEVLVGFDSYVTCLDNFSTGRMENIQHLLTKGNFRLINSDVVSADLSGKYDIVVHGASIPNPDDYIRRPIEAMLPNSLGLQRILERARIDDSIVLYLSSSEVYGDAELVPTPETYQGKVSLLGERSYYDESKRFGEVLCRAYISEYGLDIRIARLFNTYGPRMDPEMKYARVIPRFIMQALKHEPITVHGDGEQTRSFLYITDAICALLKMIESKDAKREVMNLGSEEEVKIIDLARMIKRMTGSKSPIIHKDARKDDPRRRCPDIRKAKSLLKWEPRVSLEDGLIKMIEWFKGRVQHV
ncbi:MAG: GDP-mannose 4,6-dehydratase [Nitrososphaerota archaeon]|nr:GDP-mannose 4,6-dehydratase [Nitrososphaerota archaeon]